MIALLLALVFHVHAALTESQKRAVIAAIERGDFAVLDVLSIDDAPKVIPAATLEITEPGTYDFRGYDRVEISKKLKAKGIEVTCPTCPRGTSLYCR